MKRNHMAVAIALCLSALFSAGVAECYSAENLPSATAQRIEQRLAAMRNIQIDFDLEEAFTPRITKEQLEMMESLRAKGANHTFPLSGIFKYHCSWLVLDDKVRLESHPTESTAARKPSQELIVSVFRDRQEKLFDKSNSPTKEQYGSVAMKSEYPTSHIDVVLGLRIAGDKFFIDKNDLSKFIVQSIDEEQVTLTRLFEQRTHRIELSQKYGFAPIRYQILIDGEVNSDWRMSEFSHVTDFWYPRKAENITQYKGYENGKKSIRVRNLLLNSPNNLAASYPIVFPNGTLIVDRRLDENFKIVTGDQVIDDNKMHTAMGKPDESLRYWILAANAVIVVAICAFVIYRRYKARGVEGR